MKSGIRDFWLLDVQTSQNELKLHDTGVTTNRSQDQDISGRAERSACCHTHSLAPIFLKKL
jgi:hypothetical protein